MIGTPAQDAFIRSQRWAVVTTLRPDGSASNSVVFYAIDGDELIFSTTKRRVKARTLKRDPRCSVTVLDEGAPFRFATIEGRATIQEADIVPAHVAVNRAMRADAAWQPKDGYEESLAAEGRVIVRLKADRVSGVVNRG